MNSWPVEAHSYLSMLAHLSELQVKGVKHVVKGSPVGRQARVGHHIADAGQDAEHGEGDCARADAEAAAVAETSSHLQKMSKAASFLTWFPTTWLRRGKICQSFTFQATANSTAAWKLRLSLARVRMRACECARACACVRARSSQRERERRERKRGFQFLPLRHSHRERLCYRD